MRTLLAQRGAGPRRIAPRPAGSSAPLTFGQERLWFLDRVAPESPVFHVPALYHLRGPLDRARLGRALAAVVARHEVLRARLELGPDGRPRQVIEPEGAVVLLDLTPPAGARVPAAADGGEWPDEAALQAAARAFVRRPFELARGPLLRVALARLGPEDHRLVLVIHHAISEVQSLGVLTADLARAYRSDAPLEPLELQFPDFAAWQRARLDTPDHAADLAHWRERLAGLPTLQLATDRPRAAVQSFRGATARRPLPPQLARAVRAFAQREGATLFSVALAAFAAVLARRAGAGEPATDVPVGAPMTDRDRPELEPLIGFFVSTLVLRCDLSGDPGFAELVRRCQALALDAREHRDLPFEQLVDELAPGRDLSRSPLFQVALLLQNESEQGAARLELGEARLEPDPDPLALHTGTSKFDLSLIVWNRSDGGLTLAFEYDRELYDPETVEALLGHLETLLADAIARPEVPVGALELLAPEERRAIVEDWNATAAPRPEGATVHWLVEQAAELDPGALAVSEGERELTHGQLERRANVLAHRLRAAGVGPGELVAICTERHLEHTVAILATLKAGGAYVPIDLSYPADRLAYMLRDARARVVLTREDLCARIPEHQGETLAFDAERLEEHATPAELARPAPLAGARDLAYVIYTSGSTGRPKGVALEHRGLCNLTLWHRRAYGVTAADRATHLAGLAFDASVWEVWPYLTAGASLHLVPDEVRLAPRRLAEWMAARRITQSFVPTPLAEAVLKERLPEGLALEWMLTGGDKLHAPPPPGTPFRLVNHYGPTENTVVATCAEIPAAEHADADAPAPTIGSPIENVRVHVVQSAGGVLQPVPVGVPGELVIGGSSLARGYHGRPDLTAERFVPDTVGRRPDERLYRTGDLVRYGRDGGIEFLGRIDGQVKVRGFRVELGEIEAVLGRHPGVSGCAVKILTDARGDAQLAAYVVPAAASPTFDGAGERVQPGVLRAHLAAALPDYMVPAACVFLEALPLTPNGKLDRRALPDPEPEAFAADVPFAEPEGELEERIAAIWRELLGRAEVGANTNFFELGGHSLLLAQVQVRLAETVAPGLSVVELFQYPTVRSLARHLASDGQGDQAELEASVRRAAERRSRVRRRRAGPEAGTRAQRPPEAGSQARLERG